MAAVTTTPQLLLCTNRAIFATRTRVRKPDPIALGARKWRSLSPVKLGEDSKLKPLVACHAARRRPTTSIQPETENEDSRRVFQTGLWVAEAVYILWLFLLPYAPVCNCASSFTGFNFFYCNEWTFVSRIMALDGFGFPNAAGRSSMGYKFRNSEFSCGPLFEFLLCLASTQLGVVGINVIDAPVLHPMSEGLFNFVIGWTFMFAPLLFTDGKRDRYKWSLDVLWGFQMFLTNTFLIPYMAIRLNSPELDYTPSKRSQLGDVMTKGAPIVGLVGGGICLISALWALYGRMDGDFGGIAERWEFLINYLGSERLAYAFIWDIVLYSVFQPWLIGDNLQNVKSNRIGIVSYLRFVPVVGLVAYLLFLNLDEEL
ncbi:uncharacterized protein LOC126791149 isoform X1 [Argentina anserina]|uniref:uncharacterized protein LOC126791149 isoform X1 n=1 Tax=Argentina anserina TaxID=57926 RepID=UPI0021762328|nr:uncharacterized protein LOC126791149 isoform X1 [Potentilla anserina]